MSTPVNFSAGYVPPGVYVSTKSTGSVAAVGVGDTVVCLVGRGVGHMTATEAINFAGGTTYELGHAGIDPTAANFTVVAPTPGAVPYKMDEPLAPHDYSLAQSDHALPQDRVTTLVRTSTGTIPATGNVLVRYNYTDPGYYGLHSFTDYATFVAVYGPALDPVSGAIVSPLTLAAQLAFQNGARVLYAVAVNTTVGTTTSEQFSAAYALTVPNYDINIMVPLFEDAIDSGSAQAEINALKSFLNSAEAVGFPRVAIVGVANGSPNQINTADPITLATGVAYRRIVLVWPMQFQMFNPVRTVNGTVNVDGYYAAAAAAGYLANNDPNQGLTQTTIQGFTGPSSLAAANASDLTKKNSWSAAGVAVYEMNRLGQLICRHGVTTDPTNVGTKELSIVRCQDALFVGIELSLVEAGLIGTPITSNTPLMVKSLVTGALDAAAANATIANYSAVVVSQQTLPSGDPTVIQVSFNYQPTYPLNYITVTFTLDLSTGNISAPITDTAGGGGGSSALQAAG
jgi:hypothetical protein